MMSSKFSSAMNSMRSMIGAGHSIDMTGRKPPERPTTMKTRFDIEKERKQPQKRVRSEIEQEIASCRRYGSGRRRGGAAPVDSGPVPPTEVPGAKTDEGVRVNDVLDLPVAAEVETPTVKVSEVLEYEKDLGGQLATSPETNMQGNFNVIPQLDYAEYLAYQYNHFNSDSNQTEWIISRNTQNYFLRGKTAFFKLVFTMPRVQNLDDDYGARRWNNNGVINLIRTLDTQMGYNARQLYVEGFQYNLFMNMLLNSGEMPIRPQTRSPYWEKIMLQSGVFQEGTFIPGTSYAHRGQYFQQGTTAIPIQEASEFYDKYFWIQNRDDTTKIHMYLPLFFANPEFEYLQHPDTHIGFKFTAERIPWHVFNYARTATGTHPWTPTTEDLPIFERSESYMYSEHLRLDPSRAELLHSMLQYMGITHRIIDWKHYQYDIPTDSINFKQNVFDNLQAPTYIMFTFHPAQDWVDGQHPVGPPWPENRHPPTFQQTGNTVYQTGYNTYRFKEFLRQIKIHATYGNDNRIFFTLKEQPYSEYQIRESVDGEVLAKKSNPCSDYDYEMIKNLSGRNNRYEDLWSHNNDNIHYRQMGKSKDVLFLHSTPGGHLPVMTEYPELMGALQTEMQLGYMSCQEIGNTGDDYLSPATFQWRQGLPYRVKLHIQCGYPVLNRHTPQGEYDIIDYNKRIGVGPL